MFSRGFSMILEGQPNAPSTAHGARSAAATELRRSGCCDGAAQTSSVALILRVASATELVLLRRSRCCAQRCCDGAATESLLRHSCTDQLRRAHSARRVSGSVALILRVASDEDSYPVKGADH